MIKKLSKYGNSLAILIEKPILELLNITDQTQVRISTDGHRIIIEPIDKQENLGVVSTNTQIQKSYEKITKKYKTALKKLAKN